MTFEYHVAVLSAINETDRQFESYLQSRRTFISRCFVVISVMQCFPLYNYSQTMSTGIADYIGAKSVITDTQLGITYLNMQKALDIIFLKIKAIGFPYVTR